MIKYGYGELIMTEYRAIYKCRLCGEEFEGMIFEENDSLDQKNFIFSKNIVLPLLGLSGLNKMAGFSFRDLRQFQTVTIVIRVIATSKQPVNKFISK